MTRANKTEVKESTTYQLFLTLFKFVGYAIFLIALGSVARVLWELISFGWMLPEFIGVDLVKAVAVTAKGNGS